MREIFRRLKAPTPKFFRKVRNVCFSLAATGMAGYVIEDKIPDYATKALPHMVACGLVGTFLANLAKEDTVVNEKEKDEQ